MWRLIPPLLKGECISNQYPLVGNHVRIDLVEKYLIDIVAFRESMILTIQATTTVHPAFKSTFPTAPSTITVLM